MSVQHSRGLKFPAVADVPSKDGTAITAGKELATVGRERHALNLPEFIPPRLRMYPPTGGDVHHQQHRIKLPDGEPGTVGCEGQRLDGPAQIGELAHHVR